MRGAGPRLRGRGHLATQWHAGHLPPVSSGCRSDPERPEVLQLFCGEHGRHRQVSCQKAGREREIGDNTTRTALALEQPSTSARGLTAPDYTWYVVALLPMRGSGCLPRAPVTVSA